MVSSTQITTPTYSFLVFSDKLSYMEGHVSLSFQEQIGGGPPILCGQSALLSLLTRMKTSPKLTLMGYP